MAWLLVQCVVYRWILISILSIVVGVILCVKLKVRWVRSLVCLVMCISCTGSYLLFADSDTYFYIVRCGIVADVSNGMDTYKGIWLGKSSVEDVKLSIENNDFSDFDFWPCDSFYLKTGDMVMAVYDCVGHYWTEEDLGYSYSGPFDYYWYRRSRNRSYIFACPTSGFSDEEKDLLLDSMSGNLRDYKVVERG